MTKKTRGKLTTNAIGIWNDVLRISRLKTGGITVAVVVGSCAVEEWVMEKADADQILRLLQASAGDLSYTLMGGRLVVARNHEGSSFSLKQDGLTVTGRLNSEDTKVAATELAVWQASTL